MTTIRLSPEREVIIREKLWEGDISDIFNATLCDADAEDAKKFEAGMQGSWIR